MKESQKVASRVMSQWKAKAKAKVPTLLIHYNQAGIPKDGPSAGLAIALLYWSQMTKTRLPHTMAVTGEITIRGDVDPVGGIIPKFFSAIRWGVKTIFAPKQNESEWNTYLASIEPHIRSKITSMITIHWVSHWTECIPYLLQQRR